MNRRLAFTALASLVCALPQLAAAAESGAPPQITPQITIDELRARLALTPEQQAKIAPFVEERRSKLEPVRAQFKAATTRREKREALQQARAIQQDFTSKVEPALTADQQTEWRKIRAEMREQMRERWKNR